MSNVKNIKSLNQKTCTYKSKICLEWHLQYSTYFQILKIEYKHVWTSPQPFSLTITIKLLVRSHESLLVVKKCAILIWSCLLIFYTNFLRKYILEHVEKIQKCSCFVVYFKVFNDGVIMFSTYTYVPPF